MKMAVNMKASHFRKFFILIQMEVVTTELESIVLGQEVSVFFSIN
jgi:hypothetical protein